MDCQYNKDSPHRPQFEFGVFDHEDSEPEVRFDQKPLDRIIERSGLRASSDPWHSIEACDGKEITGRLALLSLFLLQRAVDVSN